MKELQVTKKIRSYDKKYVNVTK